VAVYPAFFTDATTDFISLVTITKGGKPGCWSLSLGKNIKSALSTNFKGVNSTSIPFSTGFAPASGTTPKTTSGLTTPNVTVPTIPGVTTAVKTAATVSNVVTGSFGAGTFRAAESASMAPVYNINVTGALDKEGVARQIVQILNESAARGTGGGAGIQQLA